jgi:hypothetical protein
MLTALPTRKSLVDQSPFLWAVSITRPMILTADSCLNHTNVHFRNATGVRLGSVAEVASRPETDIAYEFNRSGRSLSVSPAQAQALAILVANYSAVRAPAFS